MPSSMVQIAQKQVKLIPTAHEQTTTVLETQEQVSTVLIAQMELSILAVRQQVLCCLSSPRLVKRPNICHPKADHANKKTVLPQPTYPNLTLAAVPSCS